MKKENEVQKILLREHEKIEKMLEEFDCSSAWAEQENLAESIALVLHKHLVLEEQILYPKLNDYLGQTNSLGDMLKEHDEIRICISRLRRLCADIDKERYQQQFAELKEEIERHLELWHELVMPKIEAAEPVIDCLSNAMHLYKGKELSPAYRAEAPDMTPRHRYQPEKKELGS